MLILQCRVIAQPKLLKIYKLVCLCVPSPHTAPAQLLVPLTAEPSLQQAMLMDGEFAVLSSAHPGIADALHHAMLQLRYTEVVRHRLCATNANCRLHIYCMAVCPLSYRKTEPASTCKCICKDNCPAMLDHMHAWTLQSSTTLLCTIEVLPFSSKRLIHQQ